MKRITTFLAAIAVALVVLFSWVEPAMADQAVLVSRRIERVTGVDIARQLASQITGVEIGASGAAVTLEADGVERSIGIEFNGAADSGTGGVIGMLGLTSIAATAMRTAKRLARLFRA